MPLVHTQVFQTGLPPLHWRRFAPPDAGTYHTGMVTGPDGALWFTDSGRGLFRIDMHGKTNLFRLTYMEGGKVRHYNPAFITVGADGKFYMDEAANLSVAVFSPPDDVKIIHLSDETQDSTPGLGPDGNVWVTALDHIIRITPRGQVTYVKYPNGGLSNIFSGIAAGPDGNVWFTEHEPYRVDKIDPRTLQITQYSFGCQPEGIAAGGDGNIYVGCPGGVARVTASGKITYITYSPGAEVSPGSFIEGPDGDIYFGTFTDQATLAHLNVNTEAIESIAIPFHGVGIASQASGPDGNIWDVDGQGYVNVFIRDILDVSPAAVRLSPGSKTTLNATYTGEGTLSAKSSNGAIARVTPGGGDTFFVTGVSQGTATVTISDAIGNFFEIAVTVRH